MSARVREPAVAGTFYPGRARSLDRAVAELLQRPPAATTPPVPVPVSPPPKAIVAPHAGYVYSGPVAASAYGCLAPLRTVVRRVVLLGPAHRTRLAGLAVPSVDAFRTPLGDVPVDSEARAVVAALPGVRVDDAPHAPEHSIEVHLPFLQRVFSEVHLLPLVVGSATDEQVADVLDAVWGGPETLIVVSTDLSHYEDHASATAHDARTVDAILEARAEDVGPYDACGAAPLRGLMLAAARHGLEPVLLDLRTSGDTAGSRDRVVGYAAIAYTTAP